MKFSHLFKEYSVLLGAIPRRLADS